MNTNTLDSQDPYPYYDGEDLGLNYQKSESSFTIWAPTASEVVLRLYNSGDGGVPLLEKNMESSNFGLWTITLDGDYQNQYYTFQTTIDGQKMEEVADPYAKAVGVNGKRAMVVNLADTNPENWQNDTRPELVGYEDIVIYELHVRDLSVHPTSGIEQKGKFLGLTETGTRNVDGLSTGLDHIKSLGVTHIHLLPSFDYRSIDESKLEENNFNWGYDPQNYNVPEGSYSTNPFDGNIRIKEFKQMVKTLHDNGLRVIMDVVYNHTGFTETSNFNQLVPKYYYRLDSLGNFSDGASCGNEIASDKPMVRKFMLESVKYWIEEYHVDGFRFDLMGLHDIETMNAISKMAEEIDPSIFIYGEGWAGGATPLPPQEAALKANTRQLYRVAAFSDDVRDGVKGHVFTPEAGGFIQGNMGLHESVKFGIVASTDHPQIDYGSVNYSNEAWADSPLKTITYASCHDNNTLWDKIALTRPDASESDRKKMHLLGLSIILTSQGVPFLHAGSEMLRTKNGVENSYNSPDSINQIDWTWKTNHQDVVNYVSGLIQLRKKHPAFRMKTSEDIKKHLSFFPTDSGHLIAYHLKGNANGDSWANIIVCFNGGESNVPFDLPEGSWKTVVNNGKINSLSEANTVNGRIEIPAYTATVLTDAQ